MEKKCNRCNIYKSYKKYNKNKSHKDGYNSICKECTEISRKNRILKYSKNPVNIEFKICNTCQVRKDVNNFVKNSSSKDGLNASCKICKNKRDKTWRSNNKEKKKNQSKGDKILLYVILMQELKVHHYTKIIIQTVTLERSLSPRKFR